MLTFITLRPFRFEHLRYSRPLPPTDDPTSPAKGRLITRRECSESGGDGVQAELAGGARAPAPKGAKDSSPIPSLTSSFLSIPSHALSELVGSGFEVPTVRGEGRNLAMGYGILSGGWRAPAQGAPPSNPVTHFPGSFGSVSLSSNQQNQAHTEIRAGR